MLAIAMSSKRLLSSRRRPGPNVDSGRLQKNLAPGLGRVDTILQVSQ